MEQVAGDSHSTPSPSIKVSEEKQEEVPYEPEEKPEPLPEPEFSLSAIDYYSEYEADKDAWKKKYQYKIVELNGTVFSYLNRVPALDSGLGIFLDADADGTSHTIMVSVNEDRPWLKYLPGSEIVIRGEATYTAEEIKEGVVVSSKPGEDLLKLNAEEIGSVDREKVNSRFPVPSEYISGRVKRFEDDDKTLGIFYLAAGDDREIEVRAYSDDIYELLNFRRLNTGDQVVIMGSLFLPDDDERTPFILRPIVIEPSLKLEQPPAKLRNTRYVENQPVLIFTSELIAKWMKDDPRGLERLSQRVSAGYIECTGKIASISPNELDEDERVVRMEMDPEAVVQFNFEKDDPQLKSLKTGEQAVIRGKLKVTGISQWLAGREGMYAYIIECQVVQ